MNIHRSSKGRSAQGLASGGPAAPAGGKQAFEAAPPKCAEQPPAPGPAERVRSGDLSLEDYLGLRAAHAADHLEGKLPPSSVRDIRSLLESQLNTDPALREMVEAATGRQPMREGVEGGTTAARRRSEVG